MTRGGLVYQLIERQPAPWKQAAPATFQLPGVGGAAILMRTVVGQSNDVPDPKLRVDEGLLAPDALDQYLRRPMTDDLPERLSTFFISAASHWHPESSVDPAPDDQLGFSITVTDSDNHTVTLLVQVKDEPETRLGRQAEAGRRTLDPDYGESPTIVSFAAIRSPKFGARVSQDFVDAR